MRVCDMLLPSEHQFGQCLIIMLRTEKHHAPDSSKIFVWNSRVVAFFIQYKAWRAGAPGDRLFQTSYTTINRWLSKAAVCLGFPVSMWRSHSMRRGGATTLSLRGYSLPQVMEAGRWLSERSARLYVSKGNVALLRSRSEVSAQQWQRICALAALCEQLWFIAVLDR